MSRYLALLLWLLLTPFAWAQDTTEITFSQETDTLTKQRFIDRYENVFMTKVPTRHMIKIGLSQYQQAEIYPLLNETVIGNVSLLAGYEFKFLPSFSIALSGYIPFYWPKYTIGEKLRYVLRDAQLRWFFDMRKRIKTGKSANNFSGNYISVFYNSPFKDRWDAGIGLKVGFQRRFLNSGFLDFAFALRQEREFFYYGLLHNWTFSSQVSFGFAFGDWKRSSNPPLCDILFCDQQIRQQWKIRLPETTIGYYNNKLRAGVAYERKIGDRPMSVNFQLDAAHNKGFHQIKQNYPGTETNYGMVYSNEQTVSLSVQPRYYLLTKAHQRQGKSSNGLSGLYAGANAEYYFYKGRHGNFTVPSGILRRRDHVLNAGPLVGFQLRLFQHGFLDLNTSYNIQDYLKTDRTTFGFRTKIGLGLVL